MTGAAEIVAEVARAVYGIGYILVGVAGLWALARFGPPTLAVIRDLSAALTLASGALRAAASQETIAKLERQVDEIHAAIVRR